MPGTARGQSAAKCGKISVQLWQWGRYIQIMELQKETIIEYLTEHVSCRSSDIAELLNIKLTRSRDILNALIADGIVVAEGANRNRTYRLKENSI